MPAIFYRSTPLTLALNILISVGLATLCNGVVFALGWNGTTANEIEPPGLAWVDSIVGFVWIGLFAGMAIARWLVLQTERPQSIRHSWYVTGLITFCWLYPFLTLGFQRLPGLIGNLVTIALAAWVMVQIQPSSRRGAGLIGIVLAWVVFATFYLVQLLLVNR